MAGLVAYESSDDEEETSRIESPVSTSKAVEPASDFSKPPKDTIKEQNGLDPLAQNVHTLPRSDAPPPGTNAPMVGPAFGPPADNSSVSSPLLEDDSPSTPQSPYSANRSMLRQLTLPTLPNYDIPPSPPGSPPPSINAKFEHFLELKKKGIHFNEKLSKSAALKNPSLMEKLMDFAHIDEADQYSSTLPTDIWDPHGLPEWAYKDQLAKTQQKTLKRKEDENVRVLRESVDFVPASASGESSRSGTPGLNTGRSAPKSAAERVMAGLENRGRSNSPHVQAGMKRKTRFES